MGNRPVSPDERLFYKLMIEVSCWQDRSLWLPEFAAVTIGGSTNIVENPHAQPQLPKLQAIPLQSAPLHSITLQSSILKSPSLE